MSRCPDGGSPRQYSLRIQNDGDKSMNIFFNKICKYWYLEVSKSTKGFDHICCYWYLEASGGYWEILRDSFEIYLEVSILMEILRDFFDIYRLLQSKYRYLEVFIKWYKMCKTKTVQIWKMLHPIHILLRTMLCFLCYKGYLYSLICNIHTIQYDLF